MRAVVAICLLVVSSIGYSQDFVDLANGFYRISPFNKVDSSSHQRHFSSFQFDAKAPVVLNDTNMWIFGLEYHYNSIWSATEDSTFNKLGFSSTNLQIGFEHHWNPSFKTMFMTMGRLNTDYESPDIKHYQVAGLVMFTKHRSEKFDWLYGVYANTEFFGPMIVPFFGLNYHPNEKFLLKFAAPINFEMAYRPTYKFRTGIRADGVNGSYRVRMRDSNDPYAYIDKADNNIWAFTEVETIKNVWFHLRGGISVIRQYRQYEDPEKITMKIGPVNVGDNRIPTTRMFKNGWSFEARIIYRIPRP